LNTHLLLQFFLLLFFLGAPGSLHLPNDALGIVLNGKEFGKKARAFGTLFLLGSLLQDADRIIRI
jgi:hypothetical protein